MAAVVQMAKSGVQEADMRRCRAMRAAWFWARTGNGKGKHTGGWELCMGPLGLSRGQVPWECRTPQTTVGRKDWGTVGDTAELIMQNELILDFAINAETPLYELEQQSFSDLPINHAGCCARHWVDSTLPAQRALKVNVEKFLEKSPSWGTHVVCGHVSSGFSCYKLLAFGPRHYCHRKGHWASYRVYNSRHIQGKPPLSQSPLLLSAMTRGNCPWDFATRWWGSQLSSAPPSRRHRVSFGGLLFHPAGGFKVQGHSLLLW